MPSHRTIGEPVPPGGLVHRWRRSRGVQLDYVEEAIPHTPAGEAAAPTPVVPPAPSLDSSAGRPSSGTRFSPQPRAATPGPLRSRPTGPVFNPGGLSTAAYAAKNGKTIAAQSPPIRSRHRSTRKALIRGCGLVVLAGVVVAGAGPTRTAAERWSRAAAESQLGDAATAQAAYREINGHYTSDRAQLSLTGGVDDVEIVSASDDRYCLTTRGLIGPTLWLSSSGAASTLPCR